MGQTKVFISHISEEKKIASIFKEAIEKYFLGYIDVFLSSDEQSILVGDNWLNKITEGLRGSSIILLFCSEKSVKMPWINFECGAGWGRDIPIVPICHSGLKPVSLPLPINILQGIESSNNQGLERIFSLLSKETKLNKPEVDYNKMANEIKSFENWYKKEIEISFNLSNIKTLYSELFREMKNSKLIPNTVISVTNVPERLYQKVEPFFDNLHSNNYIHALNFAQTGMELGGDNSRGIMGLLSMKLSSEVIAEIKKM